MSYSGRLIPKRDARDGGFLGDGDTFGHGDGSSFGQYAWQLGEVLIEGDDVLAAVCAFVAIEHAVECLADLAGQQDDIAFHINSTVVRGLPCTSRTAQ